MFAKKCPKCGGNVQTKVIKKTIGLGTVDIPISQFCLNPSCDWYQDFAEAKKPEDIKENVLQIGMPNINKLPEIKKPTVSSRHIIVLGVIAVVLLVLLIISSILQSPAAVQQPAKVPVLALTTSTKIPVITDTPSITQARVSNSTTQAPVSTLTPQTSEPRTYPVKIDVSHGFYPAVLTINKSDNLRWNNVESQRPRIVLLSTDNLFENWISREPDSFSFQFNKSGNYTFALAEYPTLELYPNATGKVVVR